MAILSLSDHFTLTSAERAVLALVGEGFTDAQIGDALGLKVRSVRGRLEQFRERAHIEGRYATVWAARHGPCCIYAV